MHICNYVGGGVAEIKMVGEKHVPHKTSKKCMHEKRKHYVFFLEQPFNIEVDSNNSTRLS